MGRVAFLARQKNPLPPSEGRMEESRRSGGAWAVRGDCDGRGGRVASDDERNHSRCRAYVHLLTPFLTSSGTRIRPTSSNRRHSHLGRRSNAMDSPSRTPSLRHRRPCQTPWRLLLPLPPLPPTSRYSLESFSTRTDPSELYSCDGPGGSRREGYGMGVVPVRHLARSPSQS